MTQSTLVQQPQTRNFGIDVMRGLAIFLVIVHHLALPFRLPLGASGLGDWLGRRVSNTLSYNGYEAVFVFFVLSGFLITQRAIAQHGSLQQLDWRSFYRRRSSRILPLLLCLLAVLTAFHLIGVPSFVIQGEGQSLIGALFSALTLHLNWYEGRTGWLPGAWDVLWSLSIEELFYLLFPLLCLMLPRWLMISGLVLLALSLPITRAALADTPIWQEKAYLPGMSAIAFGVLTAVLTAKLNTSRRLAVSLLLLAVIGLVGVFGFGRELWGVFGHGLMLLLCIAASCAVWACHQLRLREVIGLRWLAGMGRLSYELYLTHMFVVLPISAMVLHLSVINEYWYFLAYPPAIACCYGLAKLCERWISKPGARWTTRLLGGHRRAAIAPLPHDKSEPIQPG